MVDNDKLLNRIRILCEKLDVSSIPTSIEHAQEILRKYDPVYLSAICYTFSKLAVVAHLQIILIRSILEESAHPG